MLPRPEPRFALPPEPRSPWGAWLVAAVLQCGLMVLLVSEPQVSRAPEAFRSLLPTTIPAPAGSVIMRYDPRAIARRSKPAKPVTAAVAAAHPGSPRVTLPQGSPSVATPIGVAMVPSPDTASAAPTGSPFRQRYGNGSLWVTPMPITPQQIATELGGDSRQRIADSVLTSIVQGYLDRMAEERARQGPAVPSWVTSIGGKKVGLDQKWIYLGPIKLPAALLALLPIHGGNPTMADYNKKLGAMREDLFEAARRSANYDEFKKAVGELRDQTEQKRTYEKNRRTAPDSGHS